MWTFKMAAGGAAAQIQSKLQQQSLAFLMDHKIRGQAVMPTACLLDMAVAAGQVCYDSGPIASHEGFHVAAYIANLLSLGILFSFILKSLWCFWETVQRISYEGCVARLL